ncbi:MAG: thioredoxin family protein [Prevotella sp.]|nr:thioredoxin family protein [Prevotella sp.]
MRHCILILAWLWCLGLGAQTRGDSVFSLLQPDRLTLLVFYDPDCAECRQELFALRHSSVIETKINESLLQVLAIYTGENKELWRNHRESLPKSWLVVMAEGDIEGYDTSTLPAVYLLDADCKVMVHNPSVQQLSTLLVSLWQDP